MTAGDVRGRPPRYAVEGLLGRGGMASVYLAHDRKLNRRVALKVPADALADDEAFRARFLRESRLAARLVHPNVVRIHDAGEDDRGLYIVMEYVEGETLAHELARRGRLPPAEVAALGVDVSAALEVAHAAGLVHRDVKPHNIMRTEDGATKLADFGVARSEDSTIVTVHGTVLGSAAYVAPEQARGEQVTAAADLYSLGVVLYEALTGRLPHQGESVPELLLRRERDAPTPVRDLAPLVPRELDKAITSCLARSPDEPSAAALARQLAGSLDGAPTKALPAAPATRVLIPATALTALTRSSRRDRPAARRWRSPPRCCSGCSPSPSAYGRETTERWPPRRAHRSLGLHRRPPYPCSLRRRPCTQRRSCGPNVRTRNAATARATGEVMETAKARPKGTKSSTAAMPPAVKSRIELSSPIRRGTRRGASRGTR